MEIGFKLYCVYDRYLCLYDCNSTENAQRLHNKFVVDISYMPTAFWHLSRHGVVRVVVYTWFPFLTDNLEPVLLMFQFVNERIS